MNLKSFFKRAAIVLPLLVLVGLFIKDEDASPIGWLINAITKSPIQVWFAGVLIASMVIAGVMWLFSALIPKKSRSDSIKRPSVWCITIGLSQILIAVQAQAAVTVPVETRAKQATDIKVVVTNETGVILTAEEQAQVDQQVNQVVQATLLRLAVNPALNETTVVRTSVVGPLGVVAVIVITVAVIAGVLYIGYKLYKAIIAISKQKRKQIEDDGDKTNSLTSSTWSASFFKSYAALTPDTVDCDSDIPPFSFRFVVPSTETERVQLGPYLPASARMIPLESFYASHGLSTNLTINSYSTDDTPSSPSIITRNSAGTVMVTFDGMTNTIMIFERSPNLIDWEEVGALSAPAGSHVSFGDSEVTTQAMFYRVRTR